MNENNICMSCGEEKEEVDLDNLEDYCNDCKSNASAKTEKITSQLIVDEANCSPEQKKTLADDAVEYAIGTLTESDRKKLEGREDIIKEITDSLLDILGWRTN